MSTRYQVAEGREFIYPADAVSLQIVQHAGGVSKLTPEDREKVKFKTVVGGDDCSDMPVTALGIYVERGWVIPVGGTPAPVSEETWKDLGRPPDTEGGE